MPASIGLRTRIPGAARAEVTEIDGRPVVLLDVDAEVRKGALSANASSTIAHAAEMARSKGFPLIGMMGSSGADILEGMPALHGWGQAAKALSNCSGVVPVILVVTGPAVSGPALLLGLADHVVMTEDAYAFVSGPTMVAEFTGVMVDNDELGGAVVPRPLHRRGLAGGARCGRRHRRRRPAARLPARRTSTRNRPAGRAPTPPIGDARRPASSCRPPRPAATTCGR